MSIEQVKTADRKLIVGIDFGTTYSGIAWAETRRPDRQIAITSWPISKTSHEGESSDKVPTKLRYQKDDMQWGFSIPMTAPSGEIVEWFKLDLDPSLQIRAKRDPKQGETTKPDGGAEKYVTDFISALGDHLVYTLGEKLGHAVLKSTPIELVVTVPAIWSDLAKEKTRKACERAPSLAKLEAPIHLISEPEAAAIYALHGLDPHGLKVSDSFVICDAGGGTVDLITYTILKLDPILEVQEVIPGTGTMCGSTLLNNGFAKFMNKTLGHLDGFDKEVMAEAMEKFEKTIKRQFSATAQKDECYVIPVGGLANDKKLGVYRGRYTLKASQLETIFKPVVDKIVKLVLDQISGSNVPVRAVLLVGGFGASNYLKDRLREAMNKNIQVLQPANAWLAVAHGAVMKGLAMSGPEELIQVKVQNRRARKHFGMEMSVNFDEVVDYKHEDQKYWCNCSGCWKIIKMDWFTHKGDILSENKPTRVPFKIIKRVGKGRIDSWQTKVYADGVSKEAPTIKDQNVALHCLLEADVRHIPMDRLNKELGHDDEWWYVLKCHIEVTHFSASARFSLLYNGQSYDSITVAYT